MNELAVEVNNVSKTFRINKPRHISNIVKSKSNFNSQKTIIALDGISFQVKKGEILGIIGLNGSGKTTLLRIISGVYKPDSGTVHVNGRLSPLMQLGAGFQGELNAEENIILNGMLLDIPKSIIQNRVKSIIEYAGLEKFPNLRLKHYSSGMKARLAFSTAMQVDPDILLVDEIQSVGDKDFRKKSYESFLSFKKNKKTILHSTHNLDKLSEFSDRVLLLHKGKMISIGEPAEVVKKYITLNSTS